MRPPLTYMKGSLASAALALAALALASLILASLTLAFRLFLGIILF